MALRTTRQLTMALAFTALLILGHLMPSFAQDRSPVERVQLPNSDLSDDLLDLLHDF